MDMTVVRFTGLMLSAFLMVVLPAKPDNAQSAVPKVCYLDASHSALLLDLDGKKYVVDVAARSIRDAGPNASQEPSPQEPSPAADLFRQNCAGCHGSDGKGTRSAGTPDFTSPSIQSGLS